MFEIKIFFHFRNRNVTSCLSIQFEHMFNSPFFVFCHHAAQSSNVFHEVRSVDVEQRMKKPFWNYDTYVIVLDDCPSINNFFFSICSEIGLEIAEFSHVQQATDHWRLVKFCFFLLWSIIRLLHPITILNIIERNESKINPSIPIMHDVIGCLPLFQLKDETFSNENWKYWIKRRLLLSFQINK